MNTCLCGRPAFKWCPYSRTWWCAPCWAILDKTVEDIGRILNLRRKGKEVTP